MVSELIEIGTVRRAHGVRGQLRVQLHDPASEALGAVQHVLVGGPGGPQVYVLEEARDLGGGTYLVQLRGVTDRDQADALRGRPLLCDRAELPPLGEDEYYLSDLIGCAVVTPDGTEVGRVRAVPHLGGQDLLEVERPGRPEALVPLGAGFVTAVDLAGRRVEIDPPEGLLDLDRKDEEPPRRSPGSGGGGGG